MNIDSAQIVQASIFDRRCPKCFKFRQHSLFQKGHLRCTICRDDYMKKWADQNRQKINENQRVYQTTVRGRSSVLLNAAKKRAKKNGQVFKLTLIDVMDGLAIGKCAKTGLDFDLSYQYRNEKEYHMNPLSPSIDKIDPLGIYEPDNVQYVCCWYNLAKGQMTDDMLLNFCRRLVNTCP